MELNTVKDHLLTLTIIVVNIYCEQHIAKLHCICQNVTSQNDLALIHDDICRESLPYQKP
jgi:hypothetical protein